MHDSDSINNRSGNRPFAEVVAARLSRRGFVAGGLAAAAFAFVDGGAVGARGRSPAGVLGRRLAKQSAPAPSGSALVGFTSVPLQDGPTPTIAPEYEMSVILPWLEKLDGSGESFDRDGLTAEQQEQSIGIGHDGMWYFGDETSGVLCLNHEFGSNAHVLGVEEPESLEQVRISQAAHGITVVAIERGPNGWRVVDSPLNRRIHPGTAATIGGPLAGSELVETPAGNPPVGTLNNCAFGVTPWGTYLTCEENFHGYFGASGDWTPTPEQERYGFSEEGFGYGWHLFDERFDLSNADHTNEENRLGWVVEIDPNDPEAPPVKRTALGRCKHECAAVVVGADGRVVAYTGDDERFEYIFKFVSRDEMEAMQAEDVSPLDEGTLYVARFDDDGTGEWLELSPGNPALESWSLEEILVNSRGAADEVGATPMDRPEWITIGQGERVFCTLTNNSDRGEDDNPGADAANPVAPNPDGHIISWVDSDGHTGTTFEWDFFAISAFVVDDGGQMFGSPDGLWADPDGRVFVQTDGSQPGDNNDQMLVADAATGEFKRLFTGVPGCEVTGIAVTPSRTTMFANIQHPGDGDPALTNFPEDFSGADGPVPRDATVVITRSDGGVVGS